MPKMAVGVNNIHCDFNIYGKIMNLIDTQKVYSFVYVFTLRVARF